MNQKEVLEFDGFRVERESFLGGDCYGVFTSCKKDEKGVSYHLEVEFDTSTAKFHFSKCYAHEVVPCQELSAGGKLKVMAYLIEKAACAYVTEKAAVQKMSFEEFFDLFVDFKGFVDFFFLQDCVDEHYEKVNLWLGESFFEKNPYPHSASEYLAWIEAEYDFLRKRNRRIEEFCRASLEESGI